MPRPPAKAKKVSLYRFDRVEGAPLSNCIQEKYLNQDWSTREVEVAQMPALLVIGAISTETPKWVSHVERLIGVRPEAHNHSSGAVLLVPYDDYVYGLSWSFGHVILNQAIIDRGFGLRFALRRADPEHVRSLTSHTMDTLARTLLTTMPSGAGIEAFGLEEIGEIVSKLVGPISPTGLSAARGGTNERITIRGADGLSLPLGLEGTSLLADLQFLHRVVEQEQPIAGLEHFEHTRPLVAGHPALSRLKDQLGEALQPDTVARIALSWPAEWEEEHGEAQSYALRNFGRSWPDEVNDLELAHLLAPLEDRPPEQRLATLKRFKIIGLNSDGVEVSRAFAGDRWLTFETDLDNQRYVFYQGRWFNIGSAYLDMLRSRLDRVFAGKSDLELPDWPQEHKDDGKIGSATEENYNKYVASEDDAYLCMDRKLIRTQQHPRGFEACDLLGPNDELIHVKKLDGSVSASHLFNQAIVSTEALRRQPDALSKFRDKVSQLSDGNREIDADFRPDKVVLAFAGRRATTNALMTFSQVTLARCAQRIPELDSRLQIAEIGAST